MNNRAVVFDYIANCRSQVQLSTYMITDAGIVTHDVVVLHEAPARVVGEVIRLFNGVSLRPVGLIIPLIPRKR